MTLILRKQIPFDLWRAQWRHVYGGTGRYVPHLKFYSFTSMRHGATSHVFGLTNFELIINLKSSSGSKRKPGERQPAPRPKKFAKHGKLSMPPPAMRIDI